MSTHRTQNGRMMKTLLTTCTLASLLAGAALVGCASDDEATTGGETTDAGNDAVTNTGDASTTTDASPSSDAGTQTDADAAPSIPRDPFDASAPEIVCATTPCMKSIVASSRTFCATDTNDVIRCWGDPGPMGNFVNQSTTNAGATPVTLGGVGPVRDFAMADYETCVVTTTGEVNCFGAYSPDPTPVANVAGAKKVSNNDRRCAVLEDGTAWCWGSSYSLGFDEGSLSIPGDPLVDLRVQRESAFMLGESGALLSWGTQRESMGRGLVVSPDLTPSPVLDLPPVLQIAPTDDHICALAKDGRLFCWGRADSGGLGLGYVRHEFLPVEVQFPGPAVPSAIFASQTHSCARMTDGTLTCWAISNMFGELGYVDTAGVYIPTTVTSLTKKVASVALGQYSTCALLVDGSVQCFGANDSGQQALGTHDQARHPFPTTVVFQ